MPGNLRDDELVFQQAFEKATSPTTGQVSMWDEVFGFMEGKHPGAVYAPERDWEHPQIAGYENNPNFQALKGAMRAVPGASTVKDVRLRRNATQQEILEGASSKSLGWYDTETDVVDVVSLTNPNNTKKVLAHELGHSYGLKKYGSPGGSSEDFASLVADDVANNRAVNELGLRSLVRSKRGTASLQEMANTIELIKNLKATEPRYHKIFYSWEPDKGGYVPESRWR
jgi:hypothetical protein